MLRADLEGRAYNCSDTSDPGVSALGLYPQLLPETPELAPVKTVLLEQRGAGFLDGCIARGDVVLEYYGISLSFAQVVGAQCCCGLLQTGSDAVLLRAVLAASSPAATRPSAR